MFDSVVAKGQMSSCEEIFFFPSLGIPLRSKNGGARGICRGPHAESGSVEHLSKSLLDRLGHLFLRKVAVTRPSRFFLFSFSLFFFFLFPFFFYNHRFHNNRLRSGNADRLISKESEISFSPPFFLLFFSFPFFPFSLALSFAFWISLSSLWTEKRA